MAPSFLLEHLPSELQSVHTFWTSAPQQLPPLHLPLKHWLDAEHVAPSFTLGLVHVLDPMLVSYVHFVHDGDPALAA